jgi:hypothetical protein
MLRHAESVYGLPLNVASAPATSLRCITDRNIVIKRTGIRPDGLLCAQFVSDAFLPAHYVAVDRRVRALVVCIRGTANLLDSLTDVAATHDPLKLVAGGELAGGGLDLDGRRDGGGGGPGAGPGAPPPPELIVGYGHAGVLRSARQLFER